MIEENVKKLLSELKGGNGMGEPVTLVAATKTRTAEEINEAIASGITDVGENRVQEFREKSPLVHGARQHFIGHLQLNKVKYIAGKCDLVQSVDRDELAVELARRSRSVGRESELLVQVNIGNEESKGGYPLEEATAAYLRMRETEGLRPVGYMAMLPLSDDIALLSSLCKRMRALFERTREREESCRVLSMGMSGDYRLCLEHGANMIRLGTAIFGERK